MNTLKQLGCLGWSILLASCIGCGSGLEAVEGDVTFDGQPVEQGTIVFEPVDGNGTTAGGQISGGKYSLSDDKGVSPSKKTVRITAVRKTGRRILAGPPEPPNKMVDEIELYIPRDYNTNSTLTCEVDAGEKNKHDFNLKSQPK